MSCREYTLQDGQKVHGLNCNKIRQEQCSPGESMLSQVEFNNISICDTKSIDLDRSYLLLRGPAISKVHGAPLKVPLSSMDLVKSDADCHQFAYSTTIDKCYNRFNAELSAYTDTGNKMVSDTYMERLCDLDAEITCTTAWKTDCALEMDCRDSMEDYTYQFCVSTPYVRHAITFEEYYADGEPVPYNCASPPCQKSYAVIGDFAQNKILSNLIPWEGLDLSTKTGIRKCYEQTISRNTCATGEIPGASMAAEGAVTEAFADLRPKPAAISEFQECKVAASIPRKTLNVNGKPGNGNSGVGPRQPQSEGTLNLEGKNPLN